MVRGIVRPPALELANRDLVEGHLHAVWLAEAGAELAVDIPHILDLQNSELPVRSEISDTMTRPDLGVAAAATMRRILDSIDAELTAVAAPWATDREAFAVATAAWAYSRFSGAFDRWRQLYSGARAQLIEANKRSEMHGLTASERKEAKIQQLQANEQITLLERGTSSNSSDFFSYRYLATEGFLPGYNFPRLPLYAFVPAGGYQATKAAYLQRARFLAIAEFGPRSLIYHEGRAYRVHKARLSAGLRTPEGRLATASLYVCENCGAAHTEKPERCHACASAMGGHPIRDILRIDNVETQPAESITANDEERQRQGFEIQTVFTWPSRDGHPDVETAFAVDPEGPVLRIDYAPGALISRINKGLRRRKEKTILGFGIDPASGRWTKGPDEEDGDGPDGPIIQRVVPIVQDNKNAALFRIAGEPGEPEVMATIQHALARGLEMVFQLEEGETLTEPTPSRDSRRAVLAFEATEGGAGVLSRLINEPASLARVARAALDLMHLDNIDAAVAAADPELHTDQVGAECVKGCYRCLLSYYNQPDHELIDRTNIDMRRIMLRLARSKVKLETPAQDLSDPWQSAFARWNLPFPDATPLVIGDLTLRFVWRSYLVVGASNPLSADEQSEIAAKGFSVAILPSEPGDLAPPDLVALLGN
jgi:hypothetical protein